MKQIIIVDGMHCTHCEESVKKALLALDGVSEVNINLNEKSVVVVFDENQITRTQIENEIEEIGYDVVR